MKPTHKVNKTDLVAEYARAVLLVYYGWTNQPTFSCCYKFALNQTTVRLSMIWHYVKGNQLSVVSIKGSKFYCWNELTVSAKGTTVFIALFWSIYNLLRIRICTNGTVWKNVKLAATGLLLFPEVVAMICSQCLHTVKPVFSKVGSDKSVPFVITASKYENDLITTSDVTTYSMLEYKHERTLKQVKRYEIFRLWRKGTSPPFLLVFSIRLKTHLISRSFSLLCTNLRNTCCCYRTLLSACTATGLLLLLVHLPGTVFQTLSAIWMPLKLLLGAC